jgi:hypothetical protein
MVLRCPVGVLVLCIVTDPACQSNGQPYTGSGASLYSGEVGTTTKGTSNLLQENTIGKALWHQFTNVVILHEIMCQTTQTPEDAKLHRALENMQYKACTLSDISFLKSLTAGHSKGKVKLNQK